MFPLGLLTLNFILMSTNQKKEREKEEDQQEEEEKVDRRDGMCAGMFKRGDLLVVPRTLFTHFGIYLGGGR